MIQNFVDTFMAHEDAIKDRFRANAPIDYQDIVKTVVEVVGNNDGYRDTPDPDAIHRIDDGDYQGTLVFVIAERGYQPSTYWYVKVSYGSCSGCDTLESIREGWWRADTPNDEAVNDYWTLALHVVQGLKEM